MAKVKITETVLRDAPQSLIATRMTTDEMLPILEEMDKVGYYSLEAWGGATFDSCMRFFERGSVGQTQKNPREGQEHKIADALPRTEHLGYRHYAEM